MQFTKSNRTLFLVLAFALNGCGDANFAGSSATEKPKGKTIRNSGNAGVDASLTWLWPCGDANSKPRIDGDSVTLSGPGPHEVQKKNLDGKPLVIKGSACNISAYRRNIVFVIDVSGSMTSGGIFRPRGNDPINNGSCGRMDAVKAVISAVKARGNARFAVATFEDQSVHVSTSLFAQEQDLSADLLRTGNASQLTSILCRGEGNTNYNAGLQSAQNLLNAIEGDNELTEIYFISDGQPNSGESGAVLAKQLRDAGTLIATVMVGTENDSILKNEIASRDDQGAPYHSRVESSSDLARALSRLADNQVTEASVSYSENDSDDELGKFDFTTKFAGTSFAFEAFKLNLEEVPTGFTLEVNIKDRFGNLETKSGKLIWSSD